MAMKDKNIHSDNELFLNFYGIHLKFSTNDRTLFDNIFRDFSYFRSKKTEKPDITITGAKKNPDFSKVPELKATSYNKNSISYDQGSTRYVEYAGKALTVYNYRKEKSIVISEDDNYLHEITYLLIQSRIGEKLDQKGVHRVHALGIVIKGKACIVLLPSGGGKTSLALELLKDKNVFLLSEDAPFITSKGLILPFPLRMGISDASKIPKKFVRKFKRMEYGEKKIIDIEFFENKIAKPIKPSCIIVGTRTFFKNPKIKRISHAKAFKYFIRDAVIGFGLPQVVEYFLRKGFSSNFGKINIAISRAFASAKIIRRSKCYELMLSRDIKRNAEMIKNIF